MEKYLTLFFLLIPFYGFGQIKMSGKVVNNKDGKPVINANVFLSNATNGTQTLGDGSFVLNNIKKGNYELVVSMVGFETFRQSLIIDKNENNLPDIKIEPKVIGLMEVKIKSQKNANFTKSLKQFSDEFLGTSAMARDCKIINPEMLDFNYDNASNTLSASSADFLIIENLGLGYRIKYLLSNFYKISNYFGTLKTHYDGSVFFEELKGTTNQQKKWQQRRLEIYQNSSMHFLRSIIAGQMEEEGFRVYQYAFEPNSRRPPDSLIIAKVNYFLKTKAISGNAGDSLSFWTAKSKLDKNIPVLRDYPLTPVEVLKRTNASQSYELSCENDGLFVIHSDNHHFAKNGGVGHLTDPGNTKTTLITFNEPNAFFDSNGSLLSPNSLAYSGAWGNFRIAEMLPLNYEPPVELKANILQQPPINSSEMRNKVQDSLVKKISNFKKKNTNSLLYVHTDKTIYTNNETIWLAAYLMGRIKENNLTLSVALVDNNDRRLIVQELFAMKDSSWCANVNIPDTVGPGNYHLLVYANVLNSLGKPVMSFDQPVTIKTAKTSHFRSSIKLMDTIPDAKGLLKALVKIESSELANKSGFNITYTTGTKVRNARTNSLGEYIIDVLPAAGIALDVKVAKNEDVQLLKLKIPDFYAQPVVEFYPEGGDMIEGLVNLIGWEARSITGKSLRISGTVLKNGKITDTISTGYDGIGKFRLIPEKNCVYSFQILKTANISLRDTTYLLPPASPEGASIHIVNALADDTLKVKLQSVSEQKVILLVHNFNDVIAYRELTIAPLSTDIRIMLVDAPKGLATITLLDITGRPLAERIFFAHYQQTSVISLKTDRSEYMTRQKVNLRLKLKNKDGVESNAKISVACVQSNRLESSKQIDITTYAYLTSQLQQIPPDPLGKAYDNVDYVQDLLLVRGWRKYSWRSLMTGLPSDTVGSESIIRFTGQVKVSGRPLKKPVTITINNGDGIQSFDTNADGTFELEPKNMLINMGKRLRLMIAGKIPEMYSITISDPYPKISQSLAFNLSPEPATYLPVVSYSQQMLPGIDRTIALKEVIIKVQKINDSFIDGIKWHKEENGICNDFVCENGILNCSYHTITSPGSYKPFINGRYIMKGSLFPVVYKGCILFVKDDSQKTYNRIINGINLPKEYYPIDKTLISGSEPAYESTIYWNPEIKINSANEVNVSFYTGDIAGRFQLNVQGLGDNGPLSEHMSFIVKKSSQ